MNLEKILLRALEKVQAWDHRLNNPEKEREEGTEPRALTPDDVDKFLSSSKEGQEPRPHPPPPSFIEELQQLDPVRVFALRRHVKWVRKQAAKRGLPEKRIEWWEI